MTQRVKYQQIYARRMYRMGPQAVSPSQKVRVVIHTVQSVHIIGVGTNHHCLETHYRCYFLSFVNHAGYILGK